MDPDYNISSEELKNSLICSIMDLSEQEVHYLCKVIRIYCKEEKGELPPWIKEILMKG